MMIIANWKMHGSRELLDCFAALAMTGLDSKFQNLDIVLCPPAVYLWEMRALLQGTSLKLGAQNVYCEPSGAYTGEISPNMLTDIGCEFVIIGHSERRRLFGETDALIARKFAAAYDAGLSPILCVGETGEERKAGKTFEVLQGQLEAVLQAVPIQAFERALIAYEPVWAIGTGITASPEQAEEVHHWIREWIVQKRGAKTVSALRILYGGSVNAANAESLFAKPNVDGGLIGGASIKPQEFLSICERLLKAKERV